MTTCDFRYLTAAPRFRMLDSQLVSRDTGRYVDRLAITLDDFGIRYFDGREKWVRRGFPMDFASIPATAQALGKLLRRLGFFRGVTSFDPADGATLSPVVGHDADYSLQDALDVIWGWTRRAGQGTIITADALFPTPPVRTKADADRDLRFGLRLTAPARANLYYRAVATLGAWSWRKQNAPLVDAYIVACRTNTCDEWIAHVTATYTQPVIDV